MQKTGKLELTWVGKYDEVAVEPRILIEDPSKSYGDPNSENMLIHGDNLIALQALQQDYAGKIKCIYIDPPYNIDAAGVPYEDNIEHSLWLSLMRDRLTLLFQLLSDPGYICIQCDDEEQAYLKVLCDEIFGRHNFLNMLVVESGAVFGTKVAHVTKKFVKVKDYILIYKKGESVEITPLYQPLDEVYDTHYSTYINTNGEKISLVSFLKSQPDIVKLFAKHSFDVSIKNIKPLMQVDESFYKYMTEVIAKDIYTTHPYTIKLDKDVLALLDPSHAVMINGKMLTITTTGTVSVMDNFDSCLKTVINGRKIRSAYRGDLWKGFQLSMQNVDDEGGVYLKNSKKPEKLIADILSAFTEKGDIVLDSFLGSGTTAAVAQKMNRRWIGVELGDHAYSLCKVRLDNVIDGDSTGISDEYNWQGGGGYKFYELAPSLLVKNPVLPVYQINPEYTFEMLCEAICKIEGFRYKVDGVYHGYSSEKRFIHITKEFINAEYIKTVAATLGEDQSLLIYGTKIQSGLRLPDNIEVKKIPKDLLEKCTFESEVR